MLSGPKNDDNCPFFFFHFKELNVHHEEVQGQEEDKRAHQEEVRGVSLSNTHMKYSRQTDACARSCV